MLKRILFLLLVAIFISTSLFAGTTGKLAGKVTDEKTGEPIPFVNVIIKPETSGLGAQAKANGTYIILNVPPGVYEVVALRQGYHQQTQTNVEINLDLTKVLSFKLTSSAFQIEGMDIVENIIEMVQANKTGSGRTISADDMEDVAVDDLEGIIAMQAGVSMTNGEIHVRGGRSNEVAYTVDGMSVSDPVDGGNALTIDMDAVEFTDVKTGSFTAEYGNAQSGIVNIVTKSGGRDYSGKIELISDHIIPDTYHSNQDNVKFALGGPVLTPMISNLREKFTFFINGSAAWYDSRYWQEYENDPIEDLEYLSTDNFEANDPYVVRDDFAGFDLGDRLYNDYNANLKFKYQITPKTNISFSVRGDKSRFTGYRGIYDVFNYAWKYAMDHFRVGESMQNQYAATFDKTFTINEQPANLKIKGSYYHKEITVGPKGINREDFFVRNDAAFNLYDPNGNVPYNCDGISYLTNEEGLIGIESIYPWLINSDGMEKAVIPFVRPGNIYAAFQDDENSVSTLRTDFEYQLNDIHGMKTGFEIIKHNIQKNQIDTPWIIDGFRYADYLNTYGVAEDSIQSITDTTIWIPLYNLDDIFAATNAASGQTDGYESNPFQAAYYLQDKMEWEGMIVNAGLRFDFWYLGEKYKIIRDGGIASWENFDKDDRFQMMVSPRLGISHPISETAVMHFAYNYQNQLPQFRYIFTTSTPEDAITSASNVVVGQATLEPQITVTYEVGLQKQLGLESDFVMDIQAYFKNIYNYVSTREVNDSVNSNVSWFEYYSNDYGSARGIDFNLEKRLSNYIMGSASYSLSWAQGNNSDTVIQTESTNLREFALDWDMRHNFSFNVTFRVGSDEEFIIPFTNFEIPEYIIEDFSTNFYYNIASGTPYTPASERGTLLDVNSELQPHTENANLKFTKKFRFSEKVSIKTYINIENLFNRKNVINVYPITGSPYFDGADISEPNSTYVAEEVRYVHDLGSHNPANVTQGRTYTIGFSLNF
jgi:outer membrane receptor for ferrienterochelin and colicin